MIEGKVWKFGDDIDTDAIIPARYLNTSDPRELGEHCMEDADPDFAGAVQPGDVIVGGKNFGCGSSREHAPIAIKAAGVSCVIASSFARIFFRNSINIGLPILECKEAAASLQQGHDVAVDLKEGTIKNLTTGEVFEATPFPEFMQQVMAAGGLIAYTRKKVSGSA